jgi:hypothetical protein
MSKRHIAEGLDLLVEMLSSQAIGGQFQEYLVKVMPSYGSHAKRHLPMLKKLAAELPKPNSKNKKKNKKIKQKADAFNKVIKKIEAMPDKPEFELISIADYIKGAVNPYKPK